MSARYTFYTTLRGQPQVFTTYCGSGVLTALDSFHRSMQNNKGIDSGEYRINKIEKGNSEGKISYDEEDLVILQSTPKLTPEHGQTSLVFK